MDVSRRLRRRSCREWESFAKKDPENEEFEPDLAWGPGKAVAEQLE